MGRQFLPLLAEAVQIGLDVLAQTYRSQLVALGEYQRERHPVLAQPLNELEVDGHGSMTAVDEQEEVGHLLSLQDITLNHLAQALAVFLAPLGIAVAGEIHEIPAVVDEEVVDEHGLAWRRAREGQSFVASEHVDEARLAHIAAAYERILGQVTFGAAGHVGVADDEDRTLNLHGVFRGEKVKIIGKNRRFLPINRYLCRINCKNRRRKV